MMRLFVVMMMMMIMRRRRRRRRMVILMCMMNAVVVVIQSLFCVSNCRPNRPNFQKKTLVVTHTNSSNFLQKIE